VAQTSAAEEQVEQSGWQGRQVVEFETERREREVEEK
jgi:hypothetical protein